MWKFIRAEWHRKRYSPKDNLSYFIAKKVIEDTEEILQEFSYKKPACEGLVYWAGKRNDGKILVSMVVAPKTRCNSGRVSTSHRANFDVVKALDKYEMIEIAQVHSHPTAWVDHSTGDGILTAFKVEGLVSIVVPNYCKRGMLPLTKCGIRRYMDNSFKRFSDTYVRRHFKVIDGIESIFLDLRQI